MGKVVMYSSVSVDGFVADENDQPGPLFDWLSSGDVVDGVEAAVATAQELAGDRMVEVAAGDVGGQVLAAGLIDEVRMDVVPVVFGSGKRYFGSVHAQHLLEDPDVVIQGNRVLHLRYRVHRPI
ncbi:dihydrofolate reductase family protein [Microbispora sp. ATCC PTA-5024]|uniref:dihydrofolate reductase family protein n=1 Tax=Microbispora sp. ATCC PTA-5024 TaxID=316330 RepID=UPI0003DBC2EC|nr:dihydrofolate reductase family protein [Microbispora sp. ATCC PTA-5024]ETK37702.1 dihydrofolate reductase [Microbispora sp. ATCC PTA-5024]